MRTLAAIVAFCLSTTCAMAQGLSKDQYIRAMEKALTETESRSAQQARSASASRVKVAANLFYAHEALIERIPLDTLTKIVDAFADAGVFRVDLNVGLFPWVDGDRETIAKYDAVVDRIRAKGMQLALNPQYSPVKHKVGSVREWREKAIPVFGQLAERYKPDTFVVVHEPTTMTARMGTKASPEEWRDFAREAARVVKEKSGRTRIGAGGLFEEVAYFNTFVDMPEVEVLTLDIYRLVGLKEYAAMTKRAQDRGKPVYIEETWRPPYYRGRPGASLDQIAVKSVGDRSFQELDIKWINGIAKFASAVGIEAITPIWMQTFFKYADGEVDAFDPQYNKQVIEAIHRGERTKTYEAVRALARNAR